MYADSCDFYDKYIFLELQSAKHVALGIRGGKISFDPNIIFNSITHLKTDATENISDDACFIILYDILLIHVFPTVILTLTAGPVTIPEHRSLAADQ